MRKFLKYITSKRIYILHENTYMKTMKFYLKIKMYKTFVFHKTQKHLLTPKIQTKMQILVLERSKPY